eukprot:2548844-Pleurochrysis_carterae.AAC.1
MLWSIHAIEPAAARSAPRSSCLTPAKRVSRVDGCTGRPCPRRHLFLSDDDDWELRDEGVLARSPGPQGCNRRFGRPEPSLDLAEVLARQEQVLNGNWPEGTEIVRGRALPSAVAVVIPW